MTARSTLIAILLSPVLLFASGAGAEIVGDFPEVVIFGKNSVQIGQNVTVFSGDVVTNNAGGTMSLGNKVTTPAGWEVKSNTLSVGNFVNLNGTEYCNVPIGGVVCAGLAPLPVYLQLPVFQPGSAGGSAVNVPNSGSTVLTPGNYGALTVGVEGTVTFQGPGDFNFTSFTAGRKGQFVFIGGPVEIRVSGNFSSGVEDNFNLANLPVDASDIIVYVGGNAEIGDKTNMNVNFYVQGLLQIGSNVIAQGAFLGNSVVVGQKSQFTLDTFFDYQPVPTDDVAETNEDTAVPIDVLANDSDPEGDDLFVNSVTQGENGSVACSGGGGFPCAVDETLTYTPDADYFGPDSFTYEVCDVDTKANEDNCIEANVSVTVISVNDPPVAADDTPTTPEDTPVTISVLSNDTAGPPNELQDKDITAVTAPASGRAEITGTYPNEQILYSPDENYFGSDSFTYTICDNGDGADDSTVLCDSATVTVTVTPVNDPPVADSQTVETNGDVNLVITLTGSDIDGDSLTFTITAPPTEGAIVAGPTQLTPTSASVTYDPNGATDEPDQFTFQVDDGNGGTASAFVSINPFEGCVDDNDCLPGFFCNTTEGVCEPDPPNQIQANDRLSEDDKAIETSTDVAVEILLTASAPVGVDDLVFTIFSGPTSGSLSPVPPTPIDPITSPIRSAKTTYTPTCQPPTVPPEEPPSFCTASFVFQACEVAVPSNCDTATVEIIVSDFAGPAAPVAKDQAVSTPKNSNVTIDLAGPGSAQGPANEGGRSSNCGNGVVDAGEECDDGNLLNGDGCDDQCMDE